MASSFFEFQGRCDSEHPLVTVETSVRQNDVAVKIESEEVTESLNSDHRAGDRFVFRYGLWINIFSDSQAQRLKAGNLIPASSGIREMAQLLFERIQTIKEMLLENDFNQIAQALLESRAG